jgi:hypothetical protein
MAEHDSRKIHKNIAAPAKCGRPFRQKNKPIALPVDGV